MIEISKLSPGDKVKIVDEWCDGCWQNSNGDMDHWLGEIMTVREVYKPDDCVLMEEDIHECYGGGGWHWYSPAIDYIVEPEDQALLDARFKQQKDLMTLMTRE